jgi:alanyl-tRNA synthetase
LSGAAAFMLYESYGFPFEMTVEMAKEQGVKVDETAFKIEFERHKEVSKVGMEKKESAIAMRAEFQGVNTEADVAKVTRYHTAAHLMHAALKKILGPEVKQMGSNITPERLRFDFAYQRKITAEELRNIADLVNEQIQKDLAVSVEETTFEAAVAGGAHAFFKEKYPPKVTVYSMGTFSKEVCGGPHVGHTGEVGIFKIIKEEASSAGVRRIRATIE